MTGSYDPYHFREPNLSDTGVKRQHYVPRRYLNTFANEEAIQVFDRENQLTFTTSTQNAAVESFFYDLRYEEEKLSTENWFANSVEGPFWPVYDALLADPANIEALSERDEYVIGRFVAAQRLRVPHRRVYVIETRTKFREWAAELITNAIGESASAEDIDAYLADNGTIPWLRSNRTFQPGEAMSAELGEIQGDANILLAKDWILAVIEPELGLFTTDNPVATHVPAILPAWWSDFEDCEQVFPLSPGCALVFSPLRRGADIQPRGRRSFRRFSKWSSSRIRSIVAREATRFLFGSALILDLETARKNLQNIDSTARDVAIEFFGYNPDGPQPLPAQVIKLVPPGFPSL
jgi:hypothetical protein